MSPEQHAQFISDFATDYAQSKAQRIKFELKLKTLKAFLMSEALKNGEKTSSSQERVALCDPLYEQTINELVECIEKEETLKLQLQSSELQIAIWRTREASERLAIRTHE